uniref:chalcone isomerase-like protein 1 n=1 Tax=Erigeron canadensis TaxID=72917 RepID=UPI001CB8E862|nr:chalcone isomerase-like protein 1 [Erigeron canadensis]
MNSHTLMTPGEQEIKENIIVDGEAEIHENNLHEKDEEMPVEVETMMGYSFPVKLSDGKELKAIGLRKKSVLGLSFRIYSFGIYVDNRKLMDVVNSKTLENPAKATKEMYKMVIDDPAGISVKMIILISNLTMNMVRKNFNDGIGAAIWKLGGKNNELTKRIMGEATNDVKLTPGSEIEVTCLPGNVLETKVHGKVVSKLESEILCRAFVYLYLGDDPFDKVAKEKFGTCLLHSSK